MSNNFKMDGPMGREEYDKLYNLTTNSKEIKRNELKGPSGSTAQPKPEPEFKCCLCNVVMNTKDEINAHLDSELHMKKYKDLCTIVKDNTSIDEKPKYILNDDHLKFKNELLTRTMPLRDKLDKYSILTAYNFQEIAPEAIKHIKLDYFKMSEKSKIFKMWYNIKNKYEEECWTFQDPISQN